MRLSKKAQSIIEYTTILVLAIVGIVLMRPYVFRAVNAHFKSLEYSLKDSMTEDIEEGDTGDLPEPSSCDCSGPQGDPSSPDYCCAECGTCGDCICCTQKETEDKHKCNMDCGFCSDGYFLNHLDPSTCVMVNETDSASPDYCCEDDPDCGAPGGSCPDGTCGPGENTENCCEDCAECGDDKCSSYPDCENVSNCPADCCTQHHINGKCDCGEAYPAPASEHCPIPSCGWAQTANECCMLADLGKGCVWNFDATTGVGCCHVVTGGSPCYPTSGDCTHGFMPSDPNYNLCTCGSELPGCSCFVKGTLITTADGSQVPIEKIKTGDAVLAYNEDKKETRPDRVTQVFEHDAYEYLVINETLKVTANHPLLANGKWQEAGTLAIGDILLRDTGITETVRSIQTVRKNVKVYNLEVNPLHTYIAQGYIVHNKAPCDEYNYSLCGNGHCETGEGNGCCSCPSDCEHVCQVFCPE
ncbi:MAG: Hint domain-containing protein [Candidatus Omnitrophota bacterium]